MARPCVSLVVIAYDMARELPRTLRSLSPACQRGILQDDYEVIVIDNGSPRPFDQDLCQAACPNASFHRMSEPGPSPVAAINQGISLARGELVGVMIDGARMASPGLVATALQASRSHPRAVVGTIAFHLGPDVQMRSVEKGYDQATEDALLDSVDWVGNGYSLFSIAVPAGSSARGWFVLPSESNALFLTPAQWEELGGYDPRFACAGGGLANLDAWARACAMPGSQVVMLLGEATFHQVHGGVATNAPKSRWDEFHAEYVRIRGRPYQAPRETPLLFGRMPPEALPSLRATLGRDEQA